MPMTSQQYLDKGGAVCPYCNSGNLHSNPDVQFSGNVIFQPVVCLDCKQEWTDEFTLSGYSPVE